MLTLTAASRDSPGPVIAGVAAAGGTADLSALFTPMTVATLMKMMARIAEGLSMRFPDC